MLGGSELLSAVAYTALSLYSGLSSLWFLSPAWPSNLLTLISFMKPTSEISILECRSPFACSALTLTCVTLNGSSTHTKYHFPKPHHMPGLYLTLCLHYLLTLQLCKAGVPFYRWGNLASVQLSDLPITVWSAIVGIWTQVWCDIKVSLPDKSHLCLPFSHVLYAWVNCRPSEAKYDDL